METHLAEPNLDEISTKSSRLRLLLDRYDVDGVLLRRVSSFAWATAGAASYINTATTDGGAMLLVTRERVFVLTNNIEAPRLEQEEKLAQLTATAGWELRVSHWTNPQAALLELTKGLRLAADGAMTGARDISAELARLRASLLPPEMLRFRELSRRGVAAMTAAAHQVRPGMSEQQIAAVLGGETQQRGAQPIVNLIATDERVYRYRHPLPTDKKLERYAMLVLCARKWGLVTSITRLIHFGPIPQDLQHRIEATAAVFAAFVAHTRPGIFLGDIFGYAQSAYAAQGFKEEWQHHHQGGPAGYEPREFLGMPGSQDMVQAGQAYAWNPSIAGAKVEDTILVGAEANENLTYTRDWPVIRIQGKNGENPIDISAAGALVL